MSDKTSDSTTSHPRLPPKYDVVFKRLFGDSKDTRLLLALLNALLGWDEPLARVDVLDPRLGGENATDKEPALDVLAHDEEGRQFHIEIQVARQEMYLERALYYWARLYAEQLRAGDNYETLKPTISIHILADWTLAELSPTLASDTCHSRYGLLDMDSGKRLTLHQEMHIIELPEFDDALEEVEGDEARWLYFLRYGDQMTDDQTQQMGEPIAQAQDKLKRISQDDLLRAAYNARVKAARDARWLIQGPIVVAQRAQQEAEAAQQKAEAKLQKAEAELQQAEAEKQQAEAEKRRAIARAQDVEQSFKALERELALLRAKLDDDAAP